MAWERGRDTEGSHGPDPLVTYGAKTMCWTGKQSASGGRSYAQDSFGEAERTL